MAIEHPVYEHHVVPPNQYVGEQDVCLCLICNGTDDDHQEGCAVGQLEAEIKGLQDELHRLNIGDEIVLPKSRAHAKAMLLVAQAALDQMSPERDDD